MQGIKKQAWEMFISVAEQMMQEDPNIVLNYDAEQDFSDSFDTLYEQVKKEHMKHDVVYLSRHKVAAIIIIVFIRVNILDYRNCMENSMFWGNYKLAISVGLSYMLEMLNSELREGGCETIISKYIMPEVYMEDIPYTDNLARYIHLLESHDNSSISAISLAEILSFIENFTLQKYGISLRELNHF